MSDIKKDPSIWLYTVSYNEEEMMPFFLDYYREQVDKIIVYDNESNDFTRDIISRYPDVELNIFATGGKFSEEKLTDIRNKCWRDAQADFIIVCDVDEFIYCGSVGIKEFIKNRPGFDVYVPAGFDMISKKFPSIQSGGIVEQITHGSFSRAFSKPIVFSKSNIQDMNFMPGSHSARPMTRDGRKALIYESDRINFDLRLLHYKHLDLNRLIRRHERDRASRMMLSIPREDAIKPGSNIHGVHYLFDESVILAYAKKLELLSINCTEARLSLFYRLKTSAANRYSYRALREKYFVPLREWTRPIRKYIKNLFK